MTKKVTNRTAPFATYGPGEQTVRQSAEQGHCHNCPPLDADGLFSAGPTINAPSKETDMRIEFWLLTPGDHHAVGKTRTADCVPRVGDIVVLSDEDTHEVHSVHWYFDAKQPTALVMLNP